MIVFDFDGTIGDTHSIMVDAFNKVAPFFNVKKIDQQEIENLKNLTTKEFLENFKITPLKLIPFILTMRKVLEHRLMKSNVKIFPEMEKTLKTLKAENIPFGILTTNSPKVIKKVIPENLLSSFAFIKSSVLLEGKDKTLKKLKKKYKNIIYVGDEVRDIEAAKKAEITSIAVTWGFNSKSILEKSNPDFLAKTPEELTKILLELSKIKP